MDTLPFRGLPIEAKASTLESAMSFLETKAQETKPPFAILIYGSTVYGHNSRTPGTHADMDGILLLEEGLVDAERLVQSMLALGLQDIDRKLIEKQLELFNSNKIDFFRLKGHLPGNIPASFHVFRTETVQQGYRPGNAHMPIQGAVQTARENNRMRDERDFMGQAHTYPIEYSSISEHPEFSSYPAHFSRYKYAKDNPKGLIPTVGVQAEKFLTAKVIYDPGSNSESPAKAQRLLDHIWRTFVRSALLINPDATDEDILALLVRSPRYSDTYRASILQKIASERDRLTNQKAKYYHR